MDDDDITRPQRLRKLADDESKYGIGGPVKTAQKAKRMRAEADADEAMDTGERKYARGNPMHYLGVMRFIR